MILRNAPRPIRLLLLGDLALGLLYLGNKLAGAPSVKVTRLLDLDGEANLPTWFSSMQWAAGAALVGFVCMRRHEKKASAALACLALSLLFLALSVDEVSQIHEKLSIGVSGKLGSGQGRFKGMWLPALGLPMLAIAALCVRQMKPVFDAVPGSLRRLVLGLGVFGLGAFVIEPVLNILGVRAAPALILLEETLEMIGVTFVLWSLFALAEREDLLAFRDQSSTELARSA
jgi:hypothetical protein